MRYALHTSIFTFMVSILLLAGCAAEDEAADPTSQRADEAAGQLLDDTIPGDERHAIAREYGDIAPAVIRRLTGDLEPGTEDEYDRIPYIWRVSVTAGVTNEPDLILGLIEASLPEEGAPLLHWQVVVLGGGVVDGIADGGGRPRALTDEVLNGRPELQTRWNRAIGQASELADDPSVPNPTRYDALLFLGMGSWDDRSEQLISYLESDVDAELKRGAIGGLSAMNAPDVENVLLSRYDTFSERSRGTALDALMATSDRTDALLDAVESGDVPAEHLGEDRIQTLVNHADSALRTRAQDLLVP